MKSVKKRFIIFSYSLISVVSLVMSPVLVQAETQYVTDRLVITVRTGESSEYQVIKTLATGARVEVLEKSDSGYSRIRTEDETEGWVRSQYLIPEPTARERLNGIKTELKETKAEFSKLQKTYSSLNKDHVILSKKYAQLNAAKNKQDAELQRISEVAKQPIILDRQNRKLQHANINLEKALQRITQENNSLKDGSQREWFIVGALVLFIGVVLGLVLPKLRGRQSSSW